MPKQLYQQLRKEARDIDLSVPGYIAALIESIDEKTILDQQTSRKIRPVFQGMNMRERIVAGRYLSQGYKIVRSGGPDFLIYRDVDEVISQVAAIEVKAEDDELRVDQTLYGKILEAGGIPYIIERASLPTNTDWRGRRSYDSMVRLNLGITIEAELIEWLNREAKHRNISRSRMIEMIVGEYARHMPRPPKTTETPAEPATSPTAEIPSRPASVKCGECGLTLIGQTLTEHEISCSPEG